jgi:signal transduction histidine kinase/DNA-binding response OmpR family regulator
MSEWKDWPDSLSNHGGSVDRWFSFRNLSATRRFGLTATACGLPLIVFAGIIVASLLRSSTLAGNVSRHDLVQLRASQALVAAVLRMAAEGEAPLGEVTTGSQRDFNLAERDAHQALQTLVTSGPSTEDQKLLQEIDRDLQASHVHSQDPQSVSTDPSKLSASLEKAARKLVADAVDRTEGHVLLMAQSVSRTIMVVAMALATAIVGLGFLFLMGRGVTDSIARLTGDIEEITREHTLLLRVPVVGQDEFASLSRAFNQLLDDRERLDDQSQQYALELETAKIEAEEASAAKSQFLANMSHELRTPLNAIIGYSEMLHEDAVDSGQLANAKDLSQINTAGKHLLALINDILDLSKIEAGKIELFLETFDVAGVLDDIYSTIRPLLEKNGNRFELAIPADVGVLHADLTRVRQIILNLLSNASKFTTNGRVTLAVRRTRVLGVDCLEFQITDTGIGMSPDQMRRLFRSFSQADASTTRRFGGTGLGLAISRQLAQMMHGDIIVQSDEGKGSTFTLWLPSVAAPLKPLSPVLPGASPTTRGRVLIVDDEPQVLDILCRLLEAEGYEAIRASSGAEGLRLARELQPDAITLDVVMPGMDGWSVLATLKNDPQTARIPVVMLSVVDDRNLGFALGAADFLTKPLDREQLLRALSRCSPGGLGQPVLVVEDDPRTRELMRRMIEKEGWPCIEAANGEAGLRLIEEQKPALVLLDLMMPELDGFGVVLALQRKPASERPPVVVVTAKDLTEEERLRLKGSVDAVLSKGSYRREDFLGEIRRLLPPANVTGQRASLVAPAA